MSTKKDKFTKKDRFFMKLALNLARGRVGLTGDNPSVGCVIVKNDQVISLGQTGIGGTPHAEYNAIKSSKKNVSGSKIYISLEPCTHYGKTPPCSSLIIKYGIKEVIFSLIDVDKKTQGKSFKIFKKNKIKVKCGLLQNDSKKIYGPYIFNREKKLPFVTGKLAISKDNFIFSKKKLKITNHYSDKITHLLRYRNDSILISSKTLKKDNPKLNCRLNGLNKYSPTRIILDKNLSINKKSYIYKTIYKKNTVIFYQKENLLKINSLTKKGAKLIKLSTNKNNQFDLKIVLSKIFLLGYRNLLVETGRSLLHNFLKYKLFNRFYLFEGSSNLRSNGSINVTDQLQRLKLIYKNVYKLDSYLGDNVVKIYTK